MTNSEKCKALSALMGPNTDWQNDERTASRVIGMSKAFGWYGIKYGEDIRNKIIKLWERGYIYRVIAEKLDVSQSTVSHKIAAHKREMRRK